MVLTFSLVLSTPNTLRSATLRVVKIYTCECVYRQHDRANHCRIKSRQEQGQIKYYLVDNLVFDSLYELIEYYRRNRLRSANFELSLREPVPKVQQPFGKE